MPHAVIRIADHDRSLCDAHGIVLIRNQFVSLLKACSDLPVLLYQSVRQPGRLDIQVGYFASATAQHVAPSMDPMRHAVFMTDIRKLPLGFEKAGPAMRGAEVDGWYAAADVREITEELYVSLTGEQTQRGFEAPFSEAVTAIPRFWNHKVRARDRSFRERVYRAYGGRCAISGVAQMSVGGFCGLQAAHIVPRLSSPHERASAGILLAPTWHYLFDCGNIIIHDDFSWTAVVEDHDTRGIADKQLRLPMMQSDWPEVALLQQKRRLFGR